MSQELIVSTTQNIANMAGALPGQVLRFRLDADKAESILERAIVDSEKHAEHATTFIKSLTATIDNADDVRLSYTRPLDLVKTTIKVQFDESILRLRDVKAVVEGRLTVWLKAEKERKDREAEEQKAREIAEAQRIADAMRAVGDEDDADQLEELAAQLPVDTTPVRVEGTYGGGAGLQQRVTGLVGDGNGKHAFLAWAARNLSNEDLAQIKIGQRLLNTLAGKVHRAELAPIGGLLVVVEDKARVA